MQIARRVEDIYTQFGTSPGERTAQAKQLDATAYTTMKILEKMDPNDPNRAAVKDDVCRRYRSLSSSGYSADSLNTIRQDAQKVGCT